MIFWAVIAAVAVLAALWIARPFLARGTMEMNDAEGTISVFRDQRDEVARDLAEGLISPQEHDAAQREIEQRALKAARQMDGGMVVSHRSLPVAGGLVTLCVGLAVAGYSTLGTPQAADQPLAARKTEVLEQRAASGDLNARIRLMIERTAQNPNSFEDWWTLGTSYAMTGDYASAVDAFAKAAELGPEQPGVMAAYGEAMVLSNGNKVPTAARVIFEQILQDAPDPRARYYVALAKAQAQDFDGALSDWAALARDSQPTAPWMPLVRRDIVNMVRFTKTDLTVYLPDATPSEIVQAGGAAVEDIARTRATELEAALAQDPVNFQASIALAEIRAQQGDNAGAQDALEAARGHYAAAPFVLQKLNEAAERLGLDLLAPRGPSAEDIAAAAEMSDEDRDDMIDGMVSGLAAKLDENPDNPDGWIMLVRSYSVLGAFDKAQASYDKARTHFEDNPQVLAKLEAEAGSTLSQQ